MAPTTFSSREFNQDAARAKRAAAHGPVFITDRGRPAHVLLSIDAYQRLVGGGPSILDLLSAPADDAIDFAPPRAADPLFRPADLD